MHKTEYDVAVVGGGLAGLSAAIKLADAGVSVALFEKEKYPFHKVCGEYLSMESLNFLESLGLPLREMNLPLIKTLLVTSPNGKSFSTGLPLGGFGISRYKLDSSLAALAKEKGVHLFEGTKIADVKKNENFIIQISSGTSGLKSVRAKACCAAFGKRSNLDVKWERSFLRSQKKQLSNYMAVKYHVRTNSRSDLIALHNFRGGYCGISRIEDGKYCLCYMTTAALLKRYGNDMRQLEQNVLYNNPHLKEIFQNSEFLSDFPITISQINFQAKTAVENGVLMIGDSAGMITPLCGNGMSIALRTGKIAADLIVQSLHGHISEAQLQQFYTEEWRKSFASRLKIGRMLQQFFGSNHMSNFFVGSFKIFPFLAKPVIRLTHGKPF